MTGKGIRINKLFSGGKNAVIVAVDHGEFDGPINGMVDLPEAVKSITSSSDGVLLAPGMLKHCANVFNYKGAPIPIVRINWGTVYCFKWKYNEAITVKASSVEQVVSEGAEIVLISLTLKTGKEKVDAQNVKLYCELSEEAKKLGIPVIGEAFPSNHTKLSSEELHEQVYISSRILSELGADMIKTFYTKNFKEVVKACPIPILGLGAEKTPTEKEALELAKKEIDDGARGVVFGRNVLQAKNPKIFLEALCDIVKNEKSIDAVVKKYGIR